MDPIGALEQVDCGCSRARFEPSTTLSIVTSPRRKHDNLDRSASMRFSARQSISSTKRKRCGNAKLLQQPIPNGAASPVAARRHRRS
jgi:hypothetical protein